MQVKNPWVVSPGIFRLASVGQRIRRGGFLGHRGHLAHERMRQLQRTELVHRLDISTDMAMNRGESVVQAPGRPTVIEFVETGLDEFSTHGDDETFGMDHLLLSSLTDEIAGRSDIDPELLPESELLLLFGAIDQELFQALVDQVGQILLDVGAMLGLDDDVRGECEIIAHEDTRSARQTSLQRLVRAVAEAETQRVASVARCDQVIRSEELTIAFLPEGVGTLGDVPLIALQALLDEVHEASVADGIVGLGRIHHRLAAVDLVLGGDIRSGVGDESSSHGRFPCMGMGDTSHHAHSF